MGKGKFVHKDARDVIHQVYLYFAIEAEKFYTGDGYFQRVQQRLSKATGVSIKFIYLLLNEKGRLNDARRSIQFGDHKGLSKAIKRKTNENTDEDTDSEEDNQYQLFVETKDAVEDAHMEPEHSFDINVKRTRKLGEQKARPKKMKMPNKKQDKNRMPIIVSVESLEPEFEHEPALATVECTESICMSPDPALLQPQSIPHTIQSKTLTQKPPNVTPGPAFINVRPIEPNLVPKSVLEQSKKPGQVIKVYKVCHKVPKKVLEEPQSMEPRNIPLGPTILNIETKVVPIEFEPGSIKTEIISDSEGANS